MAVLQFLLAPSTHYLLLLLNLCLFLSSRSDV